MTIKLKWMRIAFLSLPANFDFKRKIILSRIHVSSGRAAELDCKLTNLDPNPWYLEVPNYNPDSLIQQAQSDLWAATLYKLMHSNENYSYNYRATNVAHWPGRVFVYVWGLKCVRAWMCGVCVWCVCVCGVSCICDVCRVCV